MSTSTNVSGLGPRVRRALISVWDKTGVVELARRLAALGVEILSTGGTAARLREAGVPLEDVSEFTGSPEILGGRVKTLHPRVHGGILAIRDDPQHAAVCAEQGIEPIDLVAVNLYPFEETIRRPGVTRAEAIEQIDIGGPTLLRSAAKNHAFVTVVCRPVLYDEVAGELERHEGRTTPALRERLALEAFRHTAAYDAAISRYLAGGDSASPARGEELPATLAEAIGPCPRDLVLRKGENDHQLGAFYGDFARHFEKLHGLGLSYNNILDLTAAVEIVEDFPAATPAVAIVKHTNPCGVATGATPVEAWHRALASDEKSAHGGIVALNRPVDRETAGAMHGFFTEVIAAPDFDAGALEVLRAKKNRRLVRVRRPLRQGSPYRIRSAAGGVLLQTADLSSAGEEAGDGFPERFRVVTRRQPTGEERRALLFAWRVVKHLKSNAIAFTSGERSLGLGAGQMSRVDAAEIAVLKARGAGIDLAGSVVASDAFFPFPDGLVVCAEAGATAAIQPGGAKRDAEVIEAADRHGMAMVLTGERHFRH